MSVILAPDVCWAPREDVHWRGIVHLASLDTESVLDVIDHERALTGAAPHVVLTFGGQTAIDPAHFFLMNSSNRVANVSRSTSRRRERP